MVSARLLRLKIEHFVLAVLVMLLGLTFLFAITSNSGFNYSTKCDEKSLKSTLDYSINDDPFPPTNLILVGVFSIARRFHRRSLIRITYLKFKPAQVTFKFVIGKPKKAAEFALVRLENEMYKDMLILDMEENQNDGKTFEYFSSIVRGSSKFDFIMKADEDVYLNFPQLLFQFHTLPKQKLYWGREIDAGSDASFMGGAAFAMSWDAVLRMAKSKECYEKRFMLEDQSVAACMRLLGIPPSSVIPESGIIDEPLTHLGWSEEYSSDNVVIHQLKRNDWFLKAYSYFTNTSFVVYDPNGDEELHTS
jgi:Galactosyltransferase